MRKSIMILCQMGVGGPCDYYSAQQTLDPGYFNYGQGPYKLRSLGFSNTETIQIAQ